MVLVHEAAERPKILVENLRPSSTLRFSITGSVPMPAGTSRALKNSGVLCPYEYVGYGDLPVVRVSCFWTKYVESRVGVVTPHFGRQMHCSHFLFFTVSFNKRVKRILSSLLCVRQWGP